MKVVDVFGNLYNYTHREVVGMDYLTDSKDKLEIVVSSNKAELKPFSGDVIEIHFPKDISVFDLMTRAKLYAKVCRTVPSLKNKTLIRNKIKELAIAHLISNGKLKKRPMHVASVQFPSKDIQINIVPIEKLFV